MIGKKNATIVDVAREAGVSVATVSRVVNGNYPVKPETKVAVSAAIEKLHYVPNVQARELNQRRSTTIGVVVPSLYNMFFAEVIDGIEAAVRKDKYSLLLNCAQNDPEQEQACIKALVARNVAGLIVISPNTKNMQEDFYKRLAERTPLVFINGYHEIAGASYVSNDEAGGMRTALASLWKLGHKRILMVRGSHSDSYEVKEKVYRSFMEEQGVLDEKLILDIGEGNGVDSLNLRCQGMCLSWALIMCPFPAMWLPNSPLWIRICSSWGRAQPLWWWKRYALAEIRKLFLAICS